MSANDGQVGGEHYKTGGLQHWDIVSRLGPIEIEGECWIWKGSQMGNGYASISHSFGHREVYQLCNGALDERDVGHTCDHRLCLNPKHLVLQTRSENIQQAVDRGRMVSGYPNRDQRGAKNLMTTLTDDQVREIRQIYAHGSISQDALAKRYNISQSAICNLINKSTWSHVK